MRRLLDSGIRIYLVAVLIFLYLPILVMALFAFNKSPLYGLPFEFDLVWFKALAGNAKLLKASWNSLWIALVNTVIATSLGTMAAVAFGRYTFRGKTMMQALLFPPIAIPWLVIGTAMLVFFFWVGKSVGQPGMARGLHAILLGHVALSLPYVILVVGARLNDYPKALEEAFADPQTAASEIVSQSFLRPFAIVEHGGVLIFKIRETAALHGLADQAFHGLGSG